MASHTPGEDGLPQEHHLGQSSFSDVEEDPFESFLWRCIGRGDRVVRQADGWWLITNALDTHDRLDT